MDTDILNKKVISIKKRYDTDGHSPYLVLTDDYEQYVLKTMNSQQDRISLIKEFICSALLSMWGIKKPTSVSLSIDSTIKEDPFFIDDRRFQLSSIYFGSEYIKNALDATNFFHLKRKPSLRQINNINTIFLIALFDIWVENDDRKPSNNNILLTPEKDKWNIIPIDHAYTFATLDFNYLNPDFLSFSDNDSILYANFARNILLNTNINTSWTASMEEKFYFCIDNFKQNASQLRKSIPQELHFNEQEQKKLEQFLLDKNRNQKVFECFVRIIMSIKKR